MQILHSGRYGYHPLNVGPSAVKAPIGLFRPRQMSQRKIRATVDAFANCSVLAREGGYDGVEIMGSEGYLINQFIATRTNHRKDDYGGSYQPHPVSFRNCSQGATRGGQRFYHHLPFIDARPRRKG